jgi:hypothetical protein
VERPNARFEPRAAARLNFLTHALGLSASDLLRQGVEALYRQHPASQAHPLPFLVRHIGAYDTGDALGSQNYKDELARGWAEKHGLEPVDAAPPIATGNKRKVAA